MESIKRGEYWWHRREDGVWLRWSAATEGWEPQASGPPPPPPPPGSAPAPVAAPSSGNGSLPGGVAVIAPLATAQPERAAVTHAPPVPAPSSPAPAPAAPAAQEQTLQPQNPTTDREEAAETARFAVVSTNPLPVVGTGEPLPANAEVYATGSAGILTRFDSRTVTMVGGALAVIFVFVLTYLGASMVFKPSEVPANAAPANVSPQKAFAMEMDQACAEASQSALGLPPPGNPGPMAAFTKKAIDNQQKLLTKMRNAAPPAKDKGLFKEIVAQSGSQLSDMKNLHSKLKARDMAAADALMKEIAVSEKRIDRMSANYGLEECGRA